MDAVSSINSTAEIAAIEVTYDADWHAASDDMSGLVDDMMGSWDTELDCDKAG